MPELRIVESTIAELAEALTCGLITSVELVALHLNRIAFYDRAGILLNAVPVLNPDAFADAAASDARRAAGGSLGPLDGIPYTAKDSYAVRGLTVAAGSPAFADLIAGDDAFTIGRLRAAGAVLLGLTNMPPMANGGMQRGLYGRAESPYSAEFLTAAFASGSSNGSGTATGASFGVFGLGEETWSSGRAPASNNGLCAYTPSRGVISVRGNWPLVPTMDVVVPHTRTMDDLFAVLDAIVADDENRRGDFWRTQHWIEIPAASLVRPADYADLRNPHALSGIRLGIPRMYINSDAGATTPIETRASVVALWRDARTALEALGAEVIEVDFPVISNYERDRPGAASMVDRGFVPEAFADHELGDLSIWAWNEFLTANADPVLGTLADVDGTKISPHPIGALPDRYGGDADFDLADYVTSARRGVTPLAQIPTIGEGLEGLERTRGVDLEDWMSELRLDAVVFPAVADVGPADADVNIHSADLAWRNGTWVANGNEAIRHLGIPTVTVPMGVMSDIRMPVGLTFAGRAYDDSALLRMAWAFERSGDRRVAAPRTPPLPEEGGRLVSPGAAAAAATPALTLTATRTAVESGDLVVDLTGTISAGDTLDEVAVFVNGSRVEAELSADGSGFTAGPVTDDRRPPHSEWLPPYGALVTAVVRTVSGAVVGGMVEVE